MSSPFLLCSVTLNGAGYTYILPFARICDENDLCILCMISKWFLLGRDTDQLIMSLMRIPSSLSNLRSCDFTSQFTFIHVISYRRVVLIVGLLCSVYIIQLKRPSGKSTCLWSCRLGLDSESGMIL